MTDPIGAWANFFVAEVGAAAALTGLLFVAVSINLPRILQFPHLPGLAFDTLMAFVSVLMVSSFGLVPNQPLCVLGAEVGIIGALSCAWQLSAFVRRYKTAKQHEGYLARTLLGQCPALCFIAVGISLVLGHGTGLYGLVPGTLLFFISGLLGAWVLLVEILR